MIDDQRYREKFIALYPSMTDQELSDALTALGFPVTARTVRRHAVALKAASSGVSAA